jgi:hypothetical protein
MRQFEVTFSIYRQNEPGKAIIGSSLTSGLKTTVAATTMGQARSMIEAQYGKNCTVHGLKPL